MFRELNGKDNAKFLLMDAGGREILSLERSVNGKIQKADIFSVPVSFNANEVTHVDTPQEALAASLNKFGEVNLEYMETSVKLTGRSCSNNWIPVSSTIP